MSRPSETASPQLDHRWAPILNEVRQGRLESSLKPLRHISTHPDEPHPSHEEASLRPLYARPQAANQYNRTHLDAQQCATLTQREVHGGLFGVFGWEWENTLRSKNKKKQIARKRVLPSRAAR